MLYRHPLTGLLLGTCLVTAGAQASPAGEADASPAAVTTAEIPEVVVIGEKTRKNQFDTATSVTTLGARSKLGTVAVLPPLQGQRIIVVGLGEVDVTPAAVRHAAGTALRTIAGIDGAEGWKVTVFLELNDPNSRRPLPRERCWVPIAAPG